ncbi:methionyl-tRNA formyltransferase [Boeremia exigua]|uniref:methionyl-tRNA formyltransferase n=1 Tax=Boeremia exigua TaxID=749465 RepID=UPI001E8D8B45|nr:methionyl-tRNA formyltransferase [Boeremia exigua]KAH6639447.1 methionyl-tRNA formyltransferase [Boeremia exigua]
MLWTLPAPARALVATALQHRAYTTRPEPLRILFCGADAFSIESLRALQAARAQTPGLIDAIHVVHRPPKPAGRGLKTLREVPIAPYARAHHLPTHPLATFTHWTPPPSLSFNLIIAVSFGLLIPPRILALTPYAGLNVHPSLLPDLRGAAPIPHALLRGREYTGVSVQTLDPARFDAGTVVAQSEAPGLRIGEGETAEALRQRLAVEGGRLLVDVLRRRGYVEPVVPGGWYAGPVAEAPKVGKGDACVDFEMVGVAGVRARLRALGDVWCVLPNGERLVVHEVGGVEDAVDGHVERGLWWDEASRELRFRAACGGVGVVRSSTYPGGQKGKGNKMVAKILRAAGRV